MTYSTRVARYVDASPAAVYRALVDPDAVARWRVPEGMTAQVHHLDAREGGTSRVSLTYDGEGTGKSGGRTDTYRGVFRVLEPDRRVVEDLEFETDDPDLRGSMTMTTLIEPAGAGSRVVLVHAGVPDSVPARDNQAGSLTALDRLAALVERRR